MLKKRNDYNATLLPIKLFYISKIPYALQQFCCQFLIQIFIKDPFYQSIFN